MRLDLVIHQARYELRAFFRNKQARFSSLVLPPLLLLVFASGLENGSTYCVPGIAALAVLLVSFANLAVSLTVQRESGVLKRRRTAPVPAPVLIVGRALAAIAASLVAVGAVCALGRLVSGVEPPIGALPALFITAVLGSTTFACLAYAVSSAIRSAGAAQPAVQAITLPLCIVSGIFVPGAGLPPWLSDLGALLPLEPLADGLRRLYDPGTHGLGMAWGDLGLLALWATAGFALAVRRFRWAPAAAGT